MPQPEPLLTLHAGDHESSSALMPVSWCAQPGLADALLAANVRDPRVVLVTQYRVTNHDYGYKTSFWRDASYTSAPLKQGFAHVTFRRPGPSRVVAFVADVADSDSRKALRKLTHEGPGSLFGDADAQLVRWRGPRSADTDSADDRARPYFSSLYSRHARSLVRLPDVLPFTVVDVDADLFARPLSAWRLWVANRVFGDAKFKDECHARSRTLVWGPLLLAPILLVANVAKLVTLPLMLLFGARRPPYEELAHPTHKFFKDFFDAPHADLSSVWWRKPARPGQTYHDWRLEPPFSAYTVALSPPVLALLPLVVFFFSKLHLRDHTHGTGKHAHTTYSALWTPHLWQAYAWVDLSLVAFLIALTALIAAVVCVAVALMATFDFLRGRRRRTPASVWAALTRPFRGGGPDPSVVRRAVALAACDDATGPRTSLTDLSPTQLTPRLIFNAAKAAVCKPFAQ